jgi:uncharacterized membrane protein
MCMNHKKSGFGYEKYLYMVLILAILIVILTLVFRFTGKVGDVSAEFSSSRIKSGETAFLEVKVTNSGNDRLIGFFNISVDDPTRVEITIDETRTNYDLLPGESINRRVEVKANSENFRSDFEFEVSAYRNETLFSKDTAILSVRK